jgi:hypothetical protein
MKKHILIGMSLLFLGCNDLSTLVEDDKSDSTEERTVQNSEEEQTKNASTEVDNSHIKELHISSQNKVYDNEIIKNATTHRIISNGIDYEYSVWYKYNDKGQRIQKSLESFNDKVQHVHYHYNNQDRLEYYEVKEKFSPTLLVRYEKYSNPDYTILNDVANWPIKYTNGIETLVNGTVDIVTELQSKKIVDIDYNGDTVIDKRYTYNFDGNDLLTSTSIEFLDFEQPLGLVGFHDIGLFESVDEESVVSDSLFNYFYDDIGRLLKKEKTVFDANKTYITTYEYNSTNHLLKMITEATTTIYSY